MRKILAVDAGGTSSRAVLLDESGACSGLGRAGGGNPTAVGIVAAVDALAAAVGGALGEGDVTSTDQDSLVVIALAGTATPPFLAMLEARLAGLGLGGRTVIEPDLLGTFCAGTAETRGYAVIAGTGAIAARVVDGQIETVKGGSGWLLGDTGSGFWIGQQVARAVVASLDGLGPSTALTPLLLEATGVERTSARSRGRAEELSLLVHELYALRPVELARFAPFAFSAIDQAPPDAVAHDILDAAAVGIAQVLAAALEPVAHDDAAALPGVTVPGVIVMGGSVLAAGLARAPAIFTPRLRAAAGDAQFVPVEDGIVGAAVLAFRHLGIAVDDELHRHLTAEIDRARAADPK
ncbi:N-acetylglucosamine kinase [Lacisediminihabitans sp. FW035]